MEYAEQGKCRCRVERGKGDSLAGQRPAGSLRPGLGRHAALPVYVAVHVVPGLEPADPVANVFKRDKQLHPEPGDGTTMAARAGARPAGIRSRHHLVPGGDPLGETHNY